MLQSKLKVNLSGLWSHSDQKFTLRYQDITEELKTILATRIKQVAPQYRIRNENGPTIEQIKETLTEINPIIFSENQRAWHLNMASYRNFNINTTRTISGYFFHKLCQAIYLLICLQRPLKKKEIKEIAYLTFNDWRKTETYINRLLPDNEIETTEENQEINTTEIDLTEMERIRQRTEQRNPEPVRQPNTSETGIETELEFTHTINGIPQERQEYIPLNQEVMENIRNSNIYLQFPEEETPAGSFFNEPNTETEENEDATTQSEQEVA